MDSKILLQNALERKTDDGRTIRAFDLLLSGAVQPGSQAGLWQVRSSDGSRTYATMTSPRETCTCRDARSNLCKHVRSATMAQEAISAAREKADEHNHPLAQFRDKLWQDMTKLVPTRLRRALSVLIIGADLAILIDRRDAAKAAADRHDGESEHEYTPQKIELIIQYRTSGGRHIPVCDDGELLQIRTDGIETAAKYPDVARARRWMQTAGYQPAGHRWIDPAGRHRRRVSTYILPTAAKLPDARDSALPVQPTRGRSKLFKT